MINAILKTYVIQAVMLVLFILYAGCKKSVNESERYIYPDYSDNFPVLTD